MPVPNILSIALRMGSGAASLGASALRRALGRDAGEPHQVEIEHRGAVRLVSPPARTGSARSEPARAQETPPGPVPRRTSNPKRARAIRKRTEASASRVEKLEVPGDTKRGAHPKTVRAENDPHERAASGRGREAAPMGSKDDRT